MKRGLALKVFSVYVSLALFLNLAFLISADDSELASLPFGDEQLMNGYYDREMFFIGGDIEFPIVSLVFPLNDSGDSDGNISFIYAVRDNRTINSCDFIMNGAVNLTDNSITKNINQSFNLTGLAAGSYNWSVNCTDNAGNTDSSESWKVGVVKAIQEYSGNTTDFSLVNLSNISNLVLESVNNGMINLSDDIDLSNGTDLDSYVNISWNRIEVNTTAVPAFAGKGSRLVFYNISFSDPRPVKDGATCSGDICTEVSFVNNIFIYDATGFSVYSSENTPVVAPSTGGSSGGGSEGGGGIAKIKELIEEPEFEVDETDFNIRLVLGDVKTREFKIKNLVSKNYSVNIGLEGLDGIVVIQNSAELQGFGEETVKFKIISPDGLDIKTGKIVLTSKDFKKEILMTINPQSKETLFDVSVDLIEDSLKKDEKLKATLYLLPVGEKGVDVSVKYLIKDYKGKVYYEYSKTFYVDKEISFTEEFKTNQLNYEDYILGVEMTYLGGFASASKHFEITEDKVLNLDKNIIILIIIIFTILCIIFFGLYRLNRLKKRSRKL